MWSPALLSNDWTMMQKDIQMANNALQHTRFPYMRWLNVKSNGTKMRMKKWLFRKEARKIETVARPTTTTAAATTNNVKKRDGRKIGIVLVAMEKKWHGKLHTMIAKAFSEPAHNKCPCTCCVLPDVGRRSLCLKLSYAGPLFFFSLLQFLNSFFHFISFFVGR